MSHRLLLIDSYSHNTGDRAILSGMRAGIRRALPNTRVTIEESHPANGSLPRFHYWHYPRFDAVISVGGGFLSSNFAWYLRCLNFLMCMVLRKPFYILGQSIGPFHSRLSREVVWYFLRKAAAVTIREPQSRESLPPSLPVALTADFAFLLPPLRKKNEHAVAVCVKKNEAVEAVLEAACQHLSKKGYTLYFLSHTPADDSEAQALAKKFKSAHFIAYSDSIDVARHIYAQCEFSICNRMHAAIFSVLGGTPFIAIAYEPKFKGLVTHLNYTQNLCIDEKKLTETTLRKAISYLLKNKTQLASHLMKECRVQKRMAYNNFAYVG